MNGLARYGALGGAVKAMGIGMALVATAILAACPSATGPKPTPGPAEGDASGGDGTAPRPATLVVTDHWARCEPGEVRPLALQISGSGASPRRFPLEPGRALSVPVPSATPLAWAVVASDDADATPVAAGGGVVAELGRVDVGCTPHALRAGSLAALVLVSGADTEVTVEVAGLAVTVSPGTRHVLLLPRGTHGVVRARDEGCAGARLAVELEGAGGLVRVGACALDSPEPL